MPAPIDAINGDPYTIAIAALDENDNPVAGWNAVLVDPASQTLLGGPAPLNAKVTPTAGAANAIIEFTIKATSGPDPQFGRHRQKVHLSS